MAPRKTPAPSLLEIKFDSASRSDYLTGFHKRKVQRAKQAREQAAKQARIDLLAERKRIRNARKEELQLHIDTVNAFANDMIGMPSVSEGRDCFRKTSSEWEGFEDTFKEIQRHEDEYAGEDVHTTITVEPITINKEGIYATTTDVEEVDEDVSGDEAALASHPPSFAVSRLKVNSKKVWTRENPARSHKKKRKFRYESKVDRKVTRMKERKGNREKAKARKE
ncbi:MAG: hypothetical protein M1829_001969 [Trizodia sp. TS-e1964]|nr:MAG: hypothetical protein M1829_001969 [Trizodia sp. TS-e1964]